MLTHADRTTYSRGANPAEGIFRRCAEVVQDLVELVDVARRFQHMDAGRDHEVRTLCP